MKELLLAKFAWCPLCAALIAVTFILAAGVLILTALLRKDQVRASFWLRSFGFSVEARGSSKAAAGTASGS